MLKKFEVSGFKGFKDKFTFDLSQASNYEFNKECVKNGTINNSIIYGRNACGKTNLSLAILDIVTHIVDKTRNFREYSSNYLHVAAKDKKANFSYTFQLDDDELVYEYSKESFSKIVSERVTINGRLCVSADRSGGDDEPLISINGTETLKRSYELLQDIAGSETSIVSYISSNSILPDEGDALVFKKFVQFVNGMLLFKSIDGNSFVGLVENGGISISKDIVKRGNIEDFERFLNENGISCKLVKSDDSDEPGISFLIDGEKVQFSEVASTGTKTLGLFYFWLQRIRESGRITLACIDEFDAYYHHELSMNIVKVLKSVGCQTILTTHNTSIMTNDLLRPDCYFVMDNQEIVNLVGATDKEIRQAHNLEKIYKSGGFSPRK